MRRSPAGSSLPTCRSAIVHRFLSISRARRSSMRKAGAAYDTSFTPRHGTGAIIMTDNLARYPSLRQRTVLVTGGASGIGAAIVEAFWQQDARVAFLDRDEKAAAKLLTQLRSPGEPPLVLNCDLTDIAAF